MKWGTVSKAAKKFKCSNFTVYKLWNRAKESCDPTDDTVPMDVKPKRKGNCGRKEIDRTEALERMRRVPMRRRQNLRSLSYAIDVPKSSLRTLLQKKKIKRVSNTLKPTLTPENEMARVGSLLHL